MTITSKCMSFTTASTGGEYKHSLTKKEMPSHFHTTVKGKDDGSTPNISDPYVTYQSENSIPIGSYYSAHTREEGGNEPHNNIQPYMTVFFWKRIK